MQRAVGRKIGPTKHLEEGMLVALVGLRETGELSNTFMEVFQRQTTGSMSRRTGDHSRGWSAMVDPIISC